MALNKLSQKRVMKLIEFMESLPRSANKHFNMSKVVAHDGRGHQHDLGANPTPDELLHACGTTACAIGWAATMPYFKRLGLQIGYYDDQTFIRGDECFRFEDEGFLESQDYFDDLFGSHNKDRTPKAWAKRARKLLREWSKA